MIKKVIDTSPFEERFKIYMKYFYNFKEVFEFAENRNMLNTSDYRELMGKLSKRGFAIDELVAKSFLEENVVKAIAELSFRLAMNSDVK